MLDDKTKIAFVGGGNMAQAILSGLVKHGHPREHLLVTAPSQKTRTLVGDRFFVRTDKCNSSAVAFADVIVLAVKPDKAIEVCMQLNDEMLAQQRSCLIISAAAGVSYQQLNGQLSYSCRIICAMPNMPTSICKGLTGLYTSQTTDQCDRILGDQIMQAVGETVWLDKESLMPSIVAAAGSSPAYFYLFMEAMEKAAIDQGLDADIAKSSILQSALGAISMAIRSEDSLTELRKQVTSPKGSTEKAIEALQTGKIDELVSRAMNSAANRVNEIYRMND